MLALHIRHVCWGQPQLVLPSGTSTSTSPWEKSECWLNWYCSLFPDCTVTCDAAFCWLTIWHMGRELSSHWHSGNDREQVKEIGSVKFMKLCDRHNNLWDYSNQSTNRICVCVSVNKCVCFWVCTAVVLWAAMPRDISLNQRETRCTAHRWLRADVDITHCNTWEKVQTWLWSRSLITDTDTKTHAHTPYHSGTVDSSC